MRRVGSVSILSCYLGCFRFACECGFSGRCADLKKLAANSFPVNFSEKNVRLSYTAIYEYWFDSEEFLRKMVILLHLCVCFLLCCLWENAVLYYIRIHEVVKCFSIITVVRSKARQIKKLLTSKILVQVKYCETMSQRLLQTLIKESNG